MEPLNVEDIGMLAAEVGDDYILKTCESMMLYVIETKGYDYINDILKKPEVE